MAETKAKIQPHPASRIRQNYPKWITRILMGWLEEHWRYPYPTERQLKQLALRTGLSRTQLVNWFTNARRRQLPKIIVAKGEDPKKYVGRRAIGKRPKPQESQMEDAESEFEEEKSETEEEKSEKDDGQGASDSDSGSPIKEEPDNDLFVDLHLLRDVAVAMADPTSVYSREWDSQKGWWRSG